MSLKRNMTPQQRKAVHKYFEEVARELNNQGVDVKVLVSRLRVDATPEMMKNIFRSIGREKYGIQSTEELTTKQITECYDEFNRLLSSEGVFIPFPSIESTEEYLNSYEQIT